MRAAIIPSLRTSGPCFKDGMARSPLSFITGPTRATYCVAHIVAWLEKSGAPESVVPELDRIRSAPCDQELPDQGDFGASKHDRRCLSALATAWIITFVASTGLVAGLAVTSAWDSPVYAQGLQAQLRRTEHRWFRTPPAEGSRISREAPVGVAFTGRRDRQLVEWS